MSNEVQTISTYLQAHWPAILSLVGGAAGLSVALEVILHKFHVDSKRLAYSLLHLFTLLTTVATYFLANLKGYDALPVYAALVIFAQTWHRFAVSPFYNKYLVPYLQWQESNKATPAELPADAPVEAEPNPFI